MVVVGGGNESHAISASLASDGHHVVTMTRHPDRFQSELCFTELLRDGSVLEGKGPARAVGYGPEGKAELMAADIVLVAVPGTAFGEVLAKLAVLLEGAAPWVVSLTESQFFHLQARAYLGKGVPVGSFSRVPFICRTRVYGASVDITSRKPAISVALGRAPDGPHGAEFVLRALSSLFRMNVTRCDSFLDVLLTPTNPIIHPARMVSILKASGLKEQAASAPIPLFYAEWDEETSRLCVELDADFLRLRCALRTIPCGILDILRHYESKSSEELTIKMRSIPSLHQLLVPNVKTESGGWRVDTGSRYFTEDLVSLAMIA